MRTTGEEWEKMRGGMGWGTWRSGDLGDGKAGKGLGWRKGHEARMEMLEEDFGVCWAPRRKNHSWDSVLVSGREHKRLWEGRVAAWLFQGAPGQEHPSVLALDFGLWLLLVAMPVTRVPRSLPVGFPVG